MVGEVWQRRLVDAHGVRMQISGLLQQLVESLFVE